MNIEKSGIEKIMIKTLIKNTVNMSIARILSKYAMESPQKQLIYVMSYFFYYFVDLKSSIEYIKTRQYSSKSASSESQRGN